MSLSVRKMLNTAVNLAPGANIVSNICFEHREENTSIKSHGHSIESFRVKQSVHSENKKSPKTNVPGNEKKWFATLKDKLQVLMKRIVTDVPSSFP